MERVALNEQLSLSRLAYGMWRLRDDPDQSTEHLIRKIQTCIDQGITTMDQADIYGDYGAEELFGLALRQAPELRDQIEIVSKCGIVAPAGPFAKNRVKYYDTGAAHINAQVDRSLSLMGVEQIDLLLIHRPDPLMDHHETGAALDMLVKAGKVRAVGVSNFAPHDWELLQSAMSTRLATNQIEVSILHHSPITDGSIAHLQREGIAPMAWSPLAGGALFSKENLHIFNMLDIVAVANSVTVDMVAIAWLLAHPARIIPVLGSNRLERISKFSDAANVMLDREDWFEIYEASLGEEVP